MQAARAVVVVTASFVVPGGGDGRCALVLRDHAVVFRGHGGGGGGGGGDRDDGRIVAVLPTSAALALHAAPDRANVVALPPRSVLMPGLVNAHTHLAMSLLRSLGDGAPLQRWLSAYIWPAETAFVSDEFCRAGVELALVEALRSGTTCVNDMYFHPRVTVECCAAAGVRAAVGAPIIRFPTNWSPRGEPQCLENVADHIAACRAVSPAGLITPTISPHSSYCVSAPALASAAALAQQHDVRVHVHVHETADEVAAERPLSTALSQAGLVSPSLIAVHCTQLTSGEITLLAERRCSVVHCPESNMKLGSGTCAVADLLAAGVNVALGTDGAASNDDHDMFGEMRSASLLSKLGGAATALPAWRVLEIATLGGARALGLEQHIGSLDVGKQCDMIALSLDSPPSHDLVAQIVNSATHHVTDVWIGGRRLMAGRCLTTLDEEAVIARATVWADRVGAHAVATDLSLATATNALATKAALAVENADAAPMKH